MTKPNRLGELVESATSQWMRDDMESDELENYRLFAERVARRVVEEACEAVEPLSAKIARSIRRHFNLEEPMSTLDERIAEWERNETLTEIRRAGCCRPFIGEGCYYTMTSEQFDSLARQLAERDRTIEQLTGSLKMVTRERNDLDNRLAAAERELELARLGGVS